MSAWAYCKCGQGMGMPTLPDLIRNGQQCQTCGVSRDLGEIDREFALLAHVEKFEAVTQAVLMLGSFLEHGKGSGPRLEEWQALKRRLSE